MKCCNLAAFDPALKARGIRGLTKASRLDHEIWQQFESDPETVGFESEVAAANVRGTELECADDLQWEDVAGLDREASTKVRVNQLFFRSMILAGYGNACCVCTMPIARLLVASHIVPWSVDRQLRMNPRNGICLCVLHDKAFDRGLLSIAGDYKIQIHRDVRKFESNQAVMHSLIAFDGRFIQMPDRWHPDPRFLGVHQQLVDAM
jgi:predicted restriction endonuclease